MQWKELLVFLMTGVHYNIEAVTFLLKQTLIEVPKLQEEGPIFFQESPNNSLKFR